MDFSFSEEQTLLQDSVQKYIQNNYGFEQRQRLIRTDQGFSDQHWSAFAELGWLALPFAEEAGGLGGSPIETMILMEAFGRGLVVEPYLPTVVLAGGLIESAGSAAHKTRQLAGIIAGTRKAALAFFEPQARFNLANVTTRARREGAAYVIEGFKGVVLGAPSADDLVVPARTAGEATDEHGISLFLVPRDSAGLGLKPYPTIDGLRAAEVSLQGVRVPADALLGEENQGLPLLLEAIDRGILAVGSEAVGCMEVLYKTTVEYCKTREQFGQPIGKFQVLQHRMVDMFMEYEQTKSLMYMAAMRMDEGTGPETRKAISAFKVQVGKAGRFIGQNAIQLHGGMGMTDELNVGHYFKRLTTIDTLFGNVDHHLRRFGRI